jgi:cytochrome P450
MISLWTLFLLCLLIAALFGGLFYYYVYLPMTYFERVGVPGPKPTSYLTGNLSEFSKYKPFTEFHYSLVKKYGNVVGFYVFQKPNLLICDPDMIKAFTVKEFDKFEDRFENGGLFPVWANGKKYNGLVFGSGDEWRALRHTATPTFSARKMKLMEPLIKQSTAKLAEKLSEFTDTEKSVDMSDMFSKMTMEVILSIAFGRNVDVLGGEGGELYRCAQLMFRNLDSEGSKFLQMLIIIGRFAPSTKSLFRRLTRLTTVSSAQQYLVDVVQKIVSKREHDKSERMDLLQLLIEACRSEKKAIDSGFLSAMSVEALLAGYDTTSNALSFTSYLLALHPDVQDRLAEEIHKHLSENPDQSLYDAANQMEYLDMVFQESLRLYPPVPVIGRACKADCVIGGIPIKAGMRVDVPIYAYHRRPEIWPEPDKFDPERFTAENKAGRHPYAHVPFGCGPRSCIGMRLAVLEAKMALIEVLDNYKLVRAPDTVVGLNVDMSVCGVMEWVCP